MKVIMLVEAIADMEARREFYQEHASTAVAVSCDAFQSSLARERGRNKYVRGSSP